jgi:hypothetical protein
VVNDQLRIGDAERETAARELGEHFAVGRITADEHAERLEQIWAARTSADLAPAFRDLPHPPLARTPGGGQKRVATGTTAVRSRAWRPQLPRVPFPLKALIAIVVIWWGLHHALFLLVGLFVYVVFVRRFVRRRRWRGRSGPWHGHYEAEWR